MRVPKYMSLKQAAALPEAWLTAFQLLFWISDLTKNSEKPVEDAQVLVHAAASGVGTSLVQMLKRVLCVKTIYATVGSDEKARYLENELGVTRAFNYKRDDEADFAMHIAALSNKRGVDVVFDCVGGTYWQKNTDSLAIDSEWILYGTMGGGNVTGDILSRIQRKRIQLKSSTLRTRTIEVETP